MLTAVLLAILLALFLASLLTVLLSCCLSDWPTTGDKWGAAKGATLRPLCSAPREPGSNDGQQVESLGLLIYFNLASAGIFIKAARPSWRPRQKAWPPAGHTTGAPLLLHTDRPPVHLGRSLVFACRCCCCALSAPSAQAAPFPHNCLWGAADV